MFFHTYDFAIPDGRGVCFLGPWLKPTVVVRMFPDDGVAARAVVQWMLRRFAAMLKDLQDSTSGVTVVDGQGTLPGTSDAWHNELHPSRNGFDEFAHLFRAALKQRFPAHVD